MHFVPIHPRTLMSIDKLGNCNMFHQHHLLVTMTQKPVISLLLVYRMIKRKPVKRIDRYSIQKSKSVIVRLPFSESSYG